MKKLMIFGAIAALTAIVLSGCATRYQIGGWHTADAKGVPVTVTVTPTVANDLYVHVWDHLSQRYASPNDYVMVHVTQLSSEAPDIVAPIDANGWTDGLPVPMAGGNVSIYVEYRDLLGNLRTTDRRTVSIYQRGRNNIEMWINTDPFH